MWPKALSQLVELAPHVSRLLPLADRYFKEKSNGDEATLEALDAHHSSLESKLDSRLDAQRAALDSRLDAQRDAITNLASRVHADLGTLTSAQATQSAAVGRQVADLEKHLSSTRADALAAKQATESLDNRLARMEAAQGRAQTLAIVGLAILLAILILIATLFLRAR